MALETYASQASDKINDDVLLKARLSCFQARDKFYACLEKQANKKPTESGTVGLLYPKECQKTRNEFVKQCRPTWVSLRNI
ncbi:hypothetical protein Leryth_007373 [Lithospermum erythrorhizon]|nr:hypothetical protein Leryth_007373 [Lithospermum erythrorhizon]